VCPDLTKVFDNIFSKKRGNIMHTDQMIPKPMKEDELEKVKKKIIQIYFSLISHTAYDPEVIELMKLSALADVQRRYDAGEPW
jgi:hypothetical protein